MMPARTSCLRGKRCPQVGVGTHREALETIGVCRRSRDRPSAVAESRAIARPDECARLRACVVAVRIREQLHGLPELRLEQGLRALELECALGPPELGEGATR